MKERERERADLTWPWLLCVSAVSLLAGSAIGLAHPHFEQHKRELNSTALCTLHTVHIRTLSTRSLISVSIETHPHIRTGLDNAMTSNTIKSNGASSFMLAYEKKDPCIYRLFCLLAAVCIRAGDCFIIPHPNSTHALPYFVGA